MCDVVVRCYRDREAEVGLMMMVGEICFSAVTMSRSFDWSIDACRPVLNRAQIVTSVVKWDEFHALLFVFGRLLSGRTVTS